MYWQQNRYTKKPRQPPLPSQLGSLGPSVAVQLMNISLLSLAPHPLSTGQFFKYKYDQYVNITNVNITNVNINILLYKNIVMHIVRYHSGESMKLNACILLLAHMVYLSPKHNSLISTKYTQ